MMIHRPIATLLLTLLMGTVSAQPSKKPFVQDGEIDGGARILRVHCPSGDVTTVRLYVENYREYKAGMTCIYRTDGSNLCKASWNHDEAAIEACKQQ